MTKEIPWVALMMLLGSTLHAQDIVGDWQGRVGSGGARIVVQIAKRDSGGWSGKFYSIDFGPDSTPISSVMLQGSKLTFAVEGVGGTYEGTISADRRSIQGTWTQGESVPLNFQRATKETAWRIDSSPHSVQFVAVDDNVKLEVLDWGGSGRPLVLLAGLGNTAHIFDRFALKLTPTYHVYGITRRGFGASSAPTPANDNYSADRLGYDVLAVLDALKLNHPVLVGHSIAGEELSSVGSRYPEKVAGLIYLDAAGSYAFYDRSRGDLGLDLIELLKKLEQLQPGNEPVDQRALIQELLETRLPKFEKDLRETQAGLEAMPPAMLAAQVSMSAVARAILAGQEKYTSIPIPILAICAVPHDMGSLIGNDPAARAKFEAYDEKRAEAQAKAFENGIPSARVVRLRNADHYVFRSNEADVLREMNAFLEKLP
ncbi:MAG TPA: alpha/beta hydrolase [Candidatus Acidoferrum sp.]|jgi:pimeloyl-ACP methyl ester carboxylesterase|nr:alpha/beta hydrolase [Candidatus Acidoferrum sp.]